MKRGNHLKLVLAKFPDLITLCFTPTSWIWLLKIDCFRCLCTWSTFPATKPTQQWHRTQNVRRFLPAWFDRYRHAHSWTFWGLLPFFIKLSYPSIKVKTEQNRTEQDRTGQDKPAEGQTKTNWDKDRDMQTRNREKERSSNSRWWLKPPKCGSA